MARHRDETCPDVDSSGSWGTPAPSSAEPNLRAGGDFASAAFAGRWSEPTGVVPPERSPMAFGYPEFEPAGSAGFEFRASSWHVGDDGFEQIGDAEVIRRGLRTPAVPAPALESDPLADPSAASANAVPSVDPGATQPVLDFEDARGDELVLRAATTSRAAEPWGRVVGESDRAFRESDLATQPVDLAALFAAEPDWTTDHPSGPLPQSGTWPPTEGWRPDGDCPTSPGSWLMRPSRSPFDATLAGASRPVELGMRGGRWFSLRTGSERPISVGEAIRSHPELAGQITQLVCWWMRQQPMSDRAVDLAHELSSAMAEMARQAAEVS